MNHQKYIEKAFRQCAINGKHYEKRTSIEFDIFVAKPDEKTRDLALYVLLEHTFDEMSVMLKKFMEENLIPWGMILFVNSGVLEPTLSTGTQRRMRAEEFDQYGPEFSNFMVEELIPEACRIAGENLSGNPDLHFICGVFSRKICPSHIFVRPAIMIQMRGATVYFTTGCLPGTSNIFSGMAIHCLLC